jgi:hypothetical protein
MDQAEVVIEWQTIFDSVFMVPVVPAPETSDKDVPECDSLTHIPLLMPVDKAFPVRFHVGGIEKTGKIGAGHSAHVFWI